PQELGCSPTVVLGTPVSAVVDDLAPRPDDRRGRPKAGNVVQNCLAVLRCQAHHAPRPEAHAAARCPARHHQQIVGPHAGHRALDGGGGTLPDFHHGDHGPDADHDSQSRQTGRQDVAPQGAEGGKKEAVKSHAPPPTASGWASAPKAPDSINPSRILIVRLACRATCASCVTRMMVMPYSWFSR